MKLRKHENNIVRIKLPVSVDELSPCVVCRWWSFDDSSLLFGLRIVTFLSYISTSRFVVS